MKGKEENTTTGICYVQKIAHKRYPPQFSLSIITVSFIITIFSYSLFVLEASLSRGICIYMAGLNRNRLHKRRTISSKVLILIASSFLLSITMIITVFPPFDYVQVPLVHAQQEPNNNSNNNTKFVSLSTISTVIGTGAIVTVPGVIKTRKH